MFGFTSPASIVTQRARLEYYGYPDGYLEQYRDNIAKVTKADILRAARKYLHPDAFKLVVIGDATKFDQPLSTQGKVRELDLKLNIPKP
jgi:predicted Zn-dependent peptidase